MRLTVLVMVAACGAAAPVPPPPERPPPPPEPLVYQPLRWGMSMVDTVAALSRAGLQPRREPEVYGVSVSRPDPTLFGDMMPLEPPEPPPKVWFVPKPGWTGEAWFTADGDRLNGVVLQAPLPAKQGHDEILRLIYRHGRPLDHRMTDMTTVQATWERDGARLTAISYDGYLTISYAYGF